MKDRRPIREQISKKYLDLAEMLPKFGGGFIANWQYQREYQRKDADETFKRTRPAQGVSIHFDRLLLVELFLLEDVGDLERRLRNLFVEVSALSRLDEELREFSDAAGDLYAGRWQFLGHITREQVNPFFWPRGVACLPKLPEEVSRIAVSIMKVLPSTGALSFEVELTEKATTNLSALLNRKYLPQFSFGGILPTRRTFSSSSELPSEQVMQNEIRNYFAKLRIRIEAQLRTKIKGIFLRSNDRSVPNMPAVEMLSIEGLTADSGRTLLEQLGSSRGWSNSFGFFGWPLDQIFYGPDCLFQLPDSFRAGKNEGYSHCRLLSIRKPRDASKSNGDDRQTFESQDMANAFACLLSLDGLLETTRQKVQKLRILVYRTLAGKVPIRWLPREIRLNDEMQLHRMILRRLQFEIGESKWILELRVRVLNSFATAREEQANGLGSYILSGIEGQLKRVCGHSEVISREISDYLQRRNLDLTFRLQKRLFWWSAAIGVLTVITSSIAAYAVVKDSELIRRFLSDAHRVLHL